MSEDSDQHIPQEQPHEVHELKFAIPFYEQVLAALQNPPAPNPIRNLIILAVTIIIFFQIGLFQDGITSVLSVILVIFIHETGHFLGMKVFGYKNIQMFFIPGFGAAVSGQSQNAPAYKKAIISLLGPVPGVVLGIILIISWYITQNHFLYTFGAMFLIINIFNLLPFFPLDGGRFLNEVLFSRNRYVEMIFRILAGLSILGIAALFKMWLLFAFGIFSLLTIGNSFKMAGVANKLKQKFGPETKLDDIVVDIVDTIHDETPKNLEFNATVAYSKDVWERFQTRPPRVLATIALLGLYGFAWLMPLIGGIVIAAVAVTNFDETVIRYTMPDGSTSYQLHGVAFDKSYYDIDIDPETRLFHGSSTSYYSDGTVHRKATWVNGKPDGNMTFYDQDGNIDKLIVLELGQLVSYKQMEDGHLVEKEWDFIPYMLQNKLSGYAVDPPKGPDEELFDNIVEMQFPEQQNLKLNTDPNGPA